MMELSSGGKRPGKEDFIFVADFGMMFNRGMNQAWGGSFHLAADDDGSRFGIGPRYRRWFKNNIALDIAPRLMFGGSSNYSVQRKFPGLALSASISVKELVSFDAYYQMLPYRQEVYNPLTFQTNEIDETETGFYFGVTGRSYLSPVIPVALGILVAATWDN
jgi:hypothetical protein